MKMDGLYPANFANIAWFKASVSTRPSLMPVVSVHLFKKQEKEKEIL